MADPDWPALAGALDGDVLTPDAPDYDDVRRPAIPNFHDVRPQAIARCATPIDVAETIAFATRHGLPFAPRSGGHCFAGGSSTRGIVVDVSAMDAVAVSDGTVAVGAGTRLGPLYDALAAHDATIPAGCGPTVGVAGLVLGGGLGILGRAYGLTSDRLVSAQVVLADGRTVRCDDERDADLFWALRGAGGCRFGIVTSVELATVAAPRMTGFHLRWPAESATRVVDAWQHWAPDAPDGLAASLLVRATGAADVAPTVNVFGSMMGAEADLTPLVDDLTTRVGAEPESTLIREGSHRDTKRLLVELFPGEENADHLYSKSEYFERSLPVEAIAKLVDHFADGRPDGETRILDFMPWGGAYNRVRPDATAFPHRSARFLIKHETAAPPARHAEAIGWLTASWSVVHPWGNGGLYVNFPDSELDDWSPAYHGVNRDRLLQVKAAYDPEDRFGQAGRSSR
ncbi:MAG TPA: FAD-binding oxidoreductase [Nocardioidaceae bacterium]|nr:FAD-binding oxidoreductase [Nocardioidaceae bacterium]